MNPDCLKEIHNIGYTRYVNICDGSFVNIEWGQLDWMVIGLGIGIILIILGLMIKITK